MNDDKYPLESFNRRCLRTLHGLNSEFCFVPEVSAAQGELQAEVCGRSYAAFMLFKSESSQISLENLHSQLSLSRPGIAGPISTLQGGKDTA